MLLKIIAEYVVSSLIDKHRDKLPDRMVNLMAADDSLDALLKKKILPNSLDALKTDYPELQRDEDLTEQVIAPAIAHVIYQTVFSGELSDSAAVQSEFEKLLAHDLSPDQQFRLRNLLDDFSEHFRRELAQHQSAGDALIMQALSRFRAEMITRFDAHANASGTAPVTVNRHSKPRIFISYSRADGEDFATDLRQRLEAEGLSLWQDRARMEGGVGWWKQITAAIEAVEFMVLVATPAAIASPIVKKEWRYARQHGVCVYPVQAPDLPLDFDAMPKWMRDRHFYNLDHEWETFVNYLKSPCTVQKVPFMAPDLPEHFVQRPEKFEALKRQLLDANFENPVAITTALKGAGGFGKTTLAAALCHDEDVQTAFDEGVLWVTLGETPNIVNALTKLYRALTDENPGFVDIEEGANKLAEKLVDADVLMVIDDVWNPAHLKPFMRGGERCARLITTRFGNIAVDHNAETLDVDEMTADESVRMLLAGIDPPEDLTPFKALAERLGEWALMLDVTNGTLRKRMAKGADLEGALDYVNKALNKRGIGGLKTGSNEAAVQVLDTSIEQVDAGNQPRLFELSIFVEDADVPLTSVMALWELDDFDTEELIDQFDDLSFVRFDAQRDTIRMHDVVREVLASRLADPIAIHTRLFDNYSDLTTLPDDYAWRNIAYHLREAKKLPTLRALLLNFDWLQAKLDATDPNALLADFDIAASPTDSGDTGQALRLVESAISTSAHVIGVDKAQFAGQLYGRLLGHGDHQPELLPLLEQVREFDSVPGLIPQLPTLSQAGGALIRTIPLEGNGNALALTEDNAHVVVTVGRKVKVFSIQTGELLTDFTTHTDRVNAVAVAGELAFSASNDETVKVWRWKTGELLTTFTAHTDRVNAVAVAGELAFSASNDETVKVWRWDTGEIFTDFTDHTGWVNAVAVAGELAFSASDDQTVKVWRWDTGEIIIDFTAHNWPVTAVAVAGELAFSASPNQTVKVWRWATGEIITDFTAHTGEVNAVAVAGELVFSASDREVKVWYWDTGEILTNFTAHTNRVNAVAAAGELAFSTDGSILGGDTVKVWRWATSETITEFTAHTGIVNAMAVAGKLIFSASNREVKVWHWDTGEILTDFTAHRGKVTAVAVASKLVFSASNREVKVWHWDTGEILTNFTAHRHQVNAMAVAGDVAFSADGAQYRRDEAGTVKVWRWDTGEIFTDFTAHTKGVTAVAVAGELAFSASDDQTVKVWRWATSETLTDFTAHRRKVNAVAVAGELAFSASDDTTVKVWRWATGEILTDFTAHTERVNAVAAAGELAFSASKDQTVKVWRWATGEILASFTADASLTSLAFDPDQRLLLAGDEGGHVHVLRVVGLDHLLFPDGA